MPTRFMSRQAFLGAAIALAAATTPLIAQDDGEAPERDNLLSTNPVLFILGWYGIEYERRIGAGTTISAGGSFVEFNDLYSDDLYADDENYLSADVKLRYYPSERAFRGFSLAASAGFARIEDTLPPAGEKVDLDALTAGVGIDYGWLLGRRDRVHLDLGIGARRLFYLNEDARADAPEALPYLRWSVGVAW